MWPFWGLLTTSCTLIWACLTHLKSVDWMTVSCIWTLRRSESTKKRLGRSFKINSRHPLVRSEYQRNSKKLPRSKSWPRNMRLSRGRGNYSPSAPSSWAGRLPFTTCSTSSFRTVVSSTLTNQICQTASRWLIWLWTGLYRRNLTRWNIFNLSTWLIARII